MKFSILITNYNKKPFLKQCVQSCLKQSYKNFEIIIFDNYSNDGSQLLLKKFEKKCIIKKQKKIGSNSAMNQIDLIKKGAKFCSGDVICLLDSDDYFFINKLKIIKKNFENNKNLSVLFDVPLLKENKKFRKQILKTFFKKNTWPTIINTSGISIKKNFLKLCIKNKFFDQYPLLEVDFRINALCKILSFEYKILNDNLTVYRLGTQGIMSKLKKYSRLWWSKRLQAHSYMSDKLKSNGQIYVNSFDCNLTKFINFFFNLSGKKS
jgi:glycosyltransferase involved in cell wall biosynthesis